MISATSEKPSKRRPARDLHFVLRHFDDLFRRARPRQFACPNCRLKGHAAAVLALDAPKWTLPSAVVIEGPLELVVHSHWIAWQSRNELQFRSKYLASADTRNLGADVPAL